MLNFAKNLNVIIGLMVDESNEYCRFFEAPRNLEDDNMQYEDYH